MEYISMAYDSDYHRSAPEEQRRRVRQHQKAIAQHEGIAKEYLSAHRPSGGSAFWADARLDRSRTATRFCTGAGVSYPRFDGPFAQAKEVLGGFALLSCTRDEGIEWTRKLLPRDGDIALITAGKSYSWFYRGGAT